MEAQTALTELGSGRRPKAIRDPVVAGTPKVAHKAFAEAESRSLPALLVCARGPPRGLWLQPFACSEPTVSREVGRVLQSLGVSDRA
jgi:hypothetical protein